MPVAKAPGRKWRRVEQGELRKATMAETSQGTARREYRAGSAASMRYKEECLTQIGMLMGNRQMWETLPTSFLTAKNRCLVFRMLSCAACCIEELLRKPHRQLPINMFRLLDP